MLRFVNAIFLFVPIVLFIYYFLGYKIDNAKNNSKIIDYIRGKLNDSCISIIYIIISVIVIFINIISCLFEYKYRLLNHYLSFTFILTSLFVLLIGTYIAIKIHGLSEIIWAFKTCKFKRKIKTVDERLKYVNSKSYGTEEKKEEIVKILNDKKNEYERLILEITVCYIDEAKDEDSNIIKKIFKW